MCYITVAHLKSFRYTLLKFSSTWVMPVYVSTKMYENTCLIFMRCEKTSYFTLFPLFIILDLKMLCIDIGEGKRTFKIARQYILSKEWLRRCILTREGSHSKEGWWWGGTGLDNCISPVLRASVGLGRTCLKKWVWSFVFTVVKKKKRLLKD